MWCATEMEDLKGMVKLPTAAKPCDVYTLVQGQSYVKLSVIQTLECDVGAYKT